MYRIEDIETAGQAIRDARIKAAITQEALASAAAITRNQLSLIERGRANVRIDTYLRVISALGSQLVIEPATSRPTLYQLRRSPEGGSS